MTPALESLWALLASNPIEAQRLKKAILFGSLTTEQVASEPMRTTGPLTGGLPGRLAWTMDSMEETDDPDVVALSGINTVTTAQGTLAGADYSIWNRATGGFVDRTTFTQGTGAFAGKRGTLLIVGTFDPITATGSSNYVAVLY